MAGAAALVLGSAAASHAATTAIPRIDQADVKASIATHHGLLTVPEAHRLGIRSNTQYADTPQAAALHKALVLKGGASSGDVRPMSSGGCNDEVCIELTGSGLVVDKWLTTAFTNGYECSYGAFWEDGELIDTGPEECGDGTLWNEALNVDFSEDTQVCNTWVGIGGRPCEEVHS